MLQSITDWAHDPIGSRELVLDRLDPTLKHAITPPVFDKTKLHRAELVDRIHAALDKSLVVIAAPAGYGKTTLLADFASHTEIPVIWLRLSEGTPGDAAQVATLIAAGLGRRFRRLSKKEAPRIHGDASPTSAARILAAWIEESIGEAFALVVDDAHSLNSSKPLLEFFDELVRLRPSELSVILAGREVPELSLARYMAEGQLTGLGPQDLSINTQEILDLTELVTGVRLSVLQADTLALRTKGWITGVLLSGLITRHTLGQADPTDFPFVYEYLASVVLNRLPDELRRFALEASILPTMTSESCDDVLQRDDSRRHLSRLSRMGVFTEMSEGEPRTYEFHPLFRDFLRETFAGTAASRVKRLRKRAAAFMVKTGALASAFHLHLEAGAIIQAERIAEINAEALLEKGSIETMSAWWTALIQAGRRPQSLGVALGSALVDRGRTDEAADVLRSIEIGSGNSSPSRLLARHANLQAEILLRKGEYAGCLARANYALRTLGKNRGHQIAVSSYRLRSLALLKVGRRPDQGIESAREAVRIAARSKNRALSASAALTLSYVLDETGFHNEANREAEVANDLLRDVGTPLQLGLSLNNLADSRHKEGKFEEALTLYALAAKEARQAASPLHEAQILFGQADLFSDLGMALQAAELYGEGLSVANRIRNAPLLQYGCLRTSVLYRRRGTLAIANDWMRRSIEVSAGGLRDPKSTIQLAALELQAAPEKAVYSLRSLLASSKSPLTGEEGALVFLFLAKTTMGRGGDSEFRDWVTKALTTAGLKGAEQVIASELGADLDLLERVKAIAAGNPTFVVILGRLEAMRTFRALHSEGAPEPHEEPRLVISGFGPGEINLDGKPIVGLKPQAKEVLFYLMERRAVGREELAERFWPAHPPGRRAANIHTVIHSIRRAIGRGVITFSDGVYLVDRETPLYYDVEQFDRTSDVAERLAHGDPRRLFALMEAINRYRGPFLLDTDTEWVAERRRSLELRYLDLVSDLSEEALLRDQPERSLNVLRSALSIDPLRDDFNYRLLESLGRLGRISEVISHYQRYTRDLRQELGIDPPAPIRELYGRLIS
jgi:ATP/maltotriose-dependent transcriptional regulator MalT/two-component SAPR family response regulator